MSVRLLLVELFVIKSVLSGIGLLGLCLSIYW